MSKSRIRANRSKLFLILIIAIFVIAALIVVYFNRFSADGPAGVPKNSYRCGLSWCYEQEPVLVKQGELKFRFSDKKTKKLIDRPFRFGTRETGKECIFNSASHGCRVLYNHQLLNEEYTPAETAKYNLNLYKLSIEKYNSRAEKVATFNTFSFGYKIDGVTNNPDRIMLVHSITVFTNVHMPENGKDGPEVLDFKNVYKIKMPFKSTTSEAQALKKFDRINGKLYTIPVISGEVINTSLGG